VPLARFAEHKLHLPLIEQMIRYRTPAFYDDILLIYVWTSELRRVQVTCDYQVRREPDNEVVVRGRAVHACMDLGEGRVCALPRGQLAAFACHSLRRRKTASCRAVHLIHLCWRASRMVGQAPSRPEPFQLVAIAGSNSQKPLAPDALQVLAEIGESVDPSVVI
jgi:Thioesterase superfamily